MLGWGLRAAVAAAGLAAGCGGEEGQSPSPSSSACGPTSASAEGWARLEVAEHPELGAVGGWVPYSDPTLFLDVNVVRVEADRVVAAWRICPHGACYLEYTPADRAFTCPCHGSRFGEDGALLSGPAERGLTTFPACADDDTVWIDARSRAGREA